MTTIYIFTIMLALLGLLAFARVVIPAFILCVTRWWANHAWQPRAALKSVLESLAARL